MIDRSRDFLAFLRQPDIAIAFLPDQFPSLQVFDGSHDAGVRDLQALCNTLNSSDSFLPAELVDCLEIILHLRAELHMLISHVRLG